MNFRSLLGLTLFLTGSLNLAHAQLPLAASPSETLIAHGTESNQRRNSAKRTLWYASIAAALGATAFDSASSWHKQEFNPLLASSNGTFGGRAVGIKIGAAAVTLIPQLILRKHTDLRNGFILGNLAETAIFSGAAIHNLNTK